MSSTTNTQQPSTSGEEKPRRRFMRRAAIATVIASLAPGIGIRAFAPRGDRGSGGSGGGHGVDAPAGPISTTRGDGCSTTWHQSGAISTSVEGSRTTNVEEDWLPGLGSNQRLPD